MFYILHRTQLTPAVNLGWGYLKGSNLEPAVEWLCCLATVERIVNRISTLLIGEMLNLQRVVNLTSVNEALKICRCD